MPGFMTIRMLRLGQLGKVLVVGAERGQGLHELREAFRQPRCGSADPGPVVRLDQRIGLPVDVTPVAMAHPVGLRQLPCGSADAGSVIGLDQRIEVRVYVARLPMGYALDLCQLRQAGACRGRARGAAPLRDGRAARPQALDVTAPRAECGRA
jgi:hypothetical protein